MQLVSHFPWTRSFDLSLLWTFVRCESEGHLTSLRCHRAHGNGPSACLSCPAVLSSSSRGATPSLARSVWARRQLVSENATEDALNHKDTQSNSGAASLRL
jgi:hypothetical protein